METKGQITSLLEEWRCGDKNARDRLFATVYDELHDLAHRRRLEWAGNDTMNTTALVHELYLRLAKRSCLGAEDRVHFYRIASKAMRQILVDYAKRSLRIKRGGSRRRVDSAVAVKSPSNLSREIEEALDVDRALSSLEKFSTQLSEIVELRFFGGLSNAEVARTLGMSERTARREWLKAKMYMRQEMQSPNEFSALG